MRHDNASAAKARNRHLDARTRNLVVKLATDRVRYELRLSGGELRPVIGWSLADIDERAVLPEMGRRFTQAHGTSQQSPPSGDG